MAIVYKSVFELVRDTIANNKEWTRSAWGRGVNEYAFELLDELAENHTRDELENASVIKALMLNGASSWSQYSWGGCSCIYDDEIAERLCTPSELARTGHGARRPNSREEWLDVQARALNQASRRVIAAFRHCVEFR